MAKFDKSETLRLAREFAEDELALEDLPAPWVGIDGPLLGDVGVVVNKIGRNRIRFDEGRHALAVARLRNNAGAAGDQLRAAWVEIERLKDYRPTRPAEQYVCTACGKTMKNWFEFEEFQHADCGGLVSLRAEIARNAAVAERDRLAVLLHTEVESAEQYAHERDVLRVDRDAWSTECQRLRTLLLDLQGFLRGLATRPELSHVATGLKNEADAIRAALVQKGGT